MKLHWCPQTRAFSAVWLLEEAGLAYERVLVDIRTGAQREEAYLAVNPMGKVPALEDGEVVVAETGAICAYVADRYPETGLAPGIADPLRGRYLEWLVFSGSCIEPAYMERFQKWEVNPEQAAWGNFDRVVAALERGLSAGPWILGERFSAADIAIGSSVNFGLKFGLLDPVPAFTAYRDRIVARDAFRRAEAIEAQGVAEREAAG